MTFGWIVAIPEPAILATIGVALIAIGCQGRKLSAGQANILDPDFPGVRGNRQEAQTRCPDQI
jgi:hypothetical protein